MKHSSCFWYIKWVLGTIFLSLALLKIWQRLDESWLLTKLDDSNNDETSLFEQSMNRKNKIVISAVPYLLKSFQANARGGFPHL